jgi:4-amino-4-deoxy-L-arabinose transferase-like glycosyltransferase
MPSTLWQRFESALALDEGPRVSAPLLIAIAAVAGASWLLFPGELPWGLRSGDAFEYAEMARRLSRGEGFTTGIIYPAELWLGADASHPAVKFPPGWPLVLAGAFLVSGPREAAAQSAVGLLFVATAVAAAALAMRLAGRTAGCVAGLAAATSLELLLFSMDAVSEPLFGFWVTLFFLLLARGSPAILVGLVCGAAYLTRYNGALLLPVALVLLWARSAAQARRAPITALAWALAGFGLLVAPWWTRNLLVAGDPFYSLLNLNLYAGSQLRLGSSVFFEIDPELPSVVAVSLAKLKSHGPRLLAHLPFAAANLAAFAGVALACVRRDRLSLGFAALAAGTLAVVALAVPLGRYFAPLLPVMLALGAAGWVRHGGRLRLPALALLLAAPLLPPIPGELSDVQYFREKWEEQRSGAATPPTSGGWSCLTDRPLLVAREAARVVWQTGAIAIYAPLDPATFWRIVDEQPVAYVQLSDDRKIPPVRPGEHFVARRDCAPALYERRLAP